MVVELHQWTAAIYLAACLVAGLSLALPAPRLSRASVVLLCLGVLVHALSFSVLHRAEPPPPLTDLPAALSFMSLVGTGFFLLLLWRVRLAQLVVHDLQTCAAAGFDRPAEGPRPRGPAQGRRQPAARPLRRAGRQVPGDRAQLLRPRRRVRPAGAGGADHLHEGAFIDLRAQ